MVFSLSRLFPGRSYPSQNEHNQAIQDVCLNVITIPKMGQAGNLSEYSLLKKSGYFEMQARLIVWKRMS
jgi:hypothetical protein